MQFSGHKITLKSVNPTKHGEEYFHASRFYLVWDVEGFS